MSAAGAASPRLPEVADPLALPLRLALLVLLLDAVMPFWFVRLPVIGLAALGLLLPDLLRSRGLWAALLLAVAWPLLWNWPFSDNHDYLRALLCLAVLVSLGARDPHATLADAARWLVGGVFLLATLWKVALSPDYLDGTFFRVTLLTDTRFENLAVLAGGMTWESWEAAEATFRRAVVEGVPPAALGLEVPAGVRRLAWVLTLWTAAIEAAVAAAFLAPRGRALSRARDALLLAFALTTFAFATVRGFGWLLAALGAAQVEPERRRTRLAYVGLFFAVELYRSVPWHQTLVSWLGRTGGLPG